MANWSKIECNCSITYTLAVVGGKWKWLILHLLAENDVLRYGGLKSRLPAITHKMLSQQLKELEADQLLHRKEYHQIPPKVEYSLTVKGQTLLPILKCMATWGDANKPAAERFEKSGSCRRIEEEK
ncbi:MAG: helix-turn-helix domain-containing protein [Sporomusaceae bacterium]|nr:helix-turn-helix domain-containing protein [Sporomusaceae bacterium]